MKSVELLVLFSTIINDLSKMKLETKVKDSNMRIKSTINCTRPLFKSDIENENNEILFNIHYLIDFLKLIDDEDVVFRFNSERFNQRSAVLINSSSGLNISHLFLIMPVRI